MNGAWSRPGASSGPGAWASQPARPEQLGTLTQGGTEWGSLAGSGAWVGWGGEVPRLGQRAEPCEQWGSGPGSLRLISADLYLSWEHSMSLTQTQRSWRCR